MATKKRSLLIVAGGLAVGVATVGFGCMAACVGVPCVSTGVSYGAWIETCPVGSPRLTMSVTASRMLREGTGRVTVDVDARFVTDNRGDTYVRQMSLWRGYDLELTVLDALGKEVDGVVVEGWKKSQSRKYSDVVLPVLPDGDYVLQVTATAAMGTETVQVPLPLYAPAVAHLMTDRALYKPGQTVLLRSVLLKRTDLAPLDGRPGQWVIRAPDGTEMLSEKDTAGSFGIADTSFPIDRYAEEGTWTARWQSGGASDEVQFDVRPFRLPRLSVDLTPSARWYGVGDELTVDGVASYTSGAPVADAPVTVQLSDGPGRWPIPIAWEEPRQVVTNAFGQFTVSFGEVPADLVDRDTLRLTARVTEAAGEVAVGSASAIVSKADLRVDAVTELGGGLVGGFNNRAYLRVATPDGRAQAGAEVEVANPWDPTQEKRVAVADADGVVAIQLDPGDPVTVVNPPAPVRVRPLVPAEPTLARAQSLLGGSLSLAERRSLDGAFSAVAACGDLAPGGVTVTTAVAVAASGQVTSVRTGDKPAETCVAAAVRRLRLPSGDERTLDLQWAVPDTLRPTLRTEVRAVFGTTGPVDQVLTAAAIRARTCLDRGRGVNGTEVLRMHWRVDDNEPALTLSVVPAASSHGLSQGELACIQGRFRGLRLADDAPRDDMGVAVVRLDVPQPPSAAVARATTRTAYELEVTASADGQRIGATRLVLPVGTIPNLRLRATPSLASPGDSVTIELFRGPDYSGDLPRDLDMYEGSVRIAEADVDPDARAATFTLPAGRDGFFHVDAYGARAVIFVAPNDPLAVTITPDKQVYRPGERATLTVRTTAGTSGQSAAVGLVGVDESLGQLAALLGPDDLGRVTVRATSDEPSFDRFDARALALGQVRGENAAKAAVLSVSFLPSDAAGDERTSVEGATVVDDTSILLVHFYRTLEALIPLVRAWETTAPAGEVMTPDRMVDMWSDALDMADRASPAVDAFGRRLELRTLPSDLLDQVDPRQVVADGTRLPEDVIGWQRYVEQEVR